jgi:hypothetical protein
MTTGPAVLRFGTGVLRREQLRSRPLLVDREK